jgi:cytochrome c553
MTARAPGHAQMGWWGGQSPRSPSGDTKQGKGIAEATCAGCHGADGNSSDPRYPKLAGQSEAYLYRQLQAFGTGARKSDIMTGIAKGLSDADMANVASFYSEQTVRPDTVTDAGLAALGEQIFFAGAGRGMGPACVMCHGGDDEEREMPMMGMMMDMMADAPRLDGQHPAYIVDQLNRFSSGERQSDVMGNIAAGLSEINRKAVAEYLSGLR